MRTRTIGEVLAQETDIAPEDYAVYLVKADETVLYVGQSASTANRLLSHLGSNPSGTYTQLGTCIQANRPASDMWAFEEYTLEDCREAVMQDREARKAPFPNAPLSKYDAELTFIRLYRPCLNVAGNPDPTPLPSHLEWRDDDNPYADQIGANLGIR